MIRLMAGAGYFSDLESVRTSSASNKSLSPGVQEGEEQNCPRVSM